MKLYKEKPFVCIYMSKPISAIAVFNSKKIKSLIYKNKIEIYKMQEIRNEYNNQII